MGKTVSEAAKGFDDANKIIPPDQNSYAIAKYINAVRRNGGISYVVKVSNRRATKTFDTIDAATAYRDAVLAGEIETPDVATRQNSLNGNHKHEHVRDLRRLVKLEILTHDDQRPSTRAECVDMPRPCPWMGCRHHLGLHVNESGGLRYHDPERLDELTHTCALDVADEGGITLDEIGDLFGVTRERIRQVEATGLRKVMGAIREYRP